MPDFWFCRRRHRVTTLSFRPAPARRAVLIRRAKMLALAAVLYNTVEAIVALNAGVAAHSIALIGFGLDSIVEMSSGLIILWQFSHPMPEDRERRALRLIALSFFALATYVTIDSVRSLASGPEAQPSGAGIIIAALSLAIMPFISHAQRRTGRELGSATVVADSQQTLLCTYLSAVLLIGLAANALWGWWFADPLVGFVIAGLAIREGLSAWRGDACTCGINPNALTEPDTCTDGCCATERTA